MKKKYSVSIGLDFETTKRLKGFESLDDAVAFVKENNRVRQPFAIWKHHEDRGMELIRIHVLGEVFVKLVI